MRLKPRMINSKHQCPGQFKLTAFMESNIYINIRDLKMMDWKFKEY